MTEPTQAERERAVRWHAAVLEDAAAAQGKRISVSLGLDKHLDTCALCVKFASELAAVRDEAHEAGHKCERSIIEIDGDGEVTPNCVHKLGPLKGVRDV